MKRIVLLLLWSASFNNLIAQEVKEEKAKKTTVKADWMIGGQVNVATNGEAIYTNFGGPNVRIEKGKFSLAFSMFPSLRIMEDAPRALVIPTLGTGVVLGYKKFQIICPLYYNTVTNDWTVAYGLGYRFK